MIPQSQQDTGQKEDLQTEPQFMLQLFIRFPEFPEFFFYLEKIPPNSFNKRDLLFADVSMSVTDSGVNPASESQE